MNETPLMTNTEAMAYFRIKDPRVWRRYQALHKIPYERIGNNKMFHRELLNKVMLKAQNLSKKIYGV